MLRGVVLRAGLLSSWARPLYGCASSRRHRLRRHCPNLDRLRTKVRVRVKARVGVMERVRLGEAEAEREGEAGGWVWVRG